MTVYLLGDVGQNGTAALCARFSALLTVSKVFLQTNITLCTLHINLMVQFGWVLCN